MLMILGSYVKERVQNLAYFWRVRPAIKWMFVGVFSKAFLADLFLSR
jgi:mannose/fructose/N-acetylgalactosamine-specific phosphotransferase system component IID